ncbi:mechanosensitive ion channel protein MscS [Photobacterium jeanii]|uniref:Small-conductance mechanosensitive channel n=1 Tax=Photobacterium jeanii TaxID=858640 RepID=A0A178K8V3_9GAMM|nr:mechanosensitive ion channel family protein [Photobacterium jeanii]OAN13768.1 mechanosensitive ion channel protein MscS [Photobacterium jeanii]PST88889.1 mechanosensitive ion channel protein MscS [Photobacterium jeanii]
MRLLCIFFLLVSSLSWSNIALAQEEKPQEETVVTTTPVEITQIEKLTAELTELLNESKTTKGSAQSVVSLQLINKNDELREVIENIVDDTASQRDLKVQYHQQILAKVKEQVAFVDEAITFLTKKIAEDELKLDDMPDEQKLLFQKKTQETHKFLLRLLDQQRINYIWLEKLDVDTSKQQAELKGVIEHKLEFLSASLNFNSQQEQMLNNQLKSAAESEKGSLQLIHILADRQVKGDISSLQALIKLGDNMKINTAEYKKQLFEQTGNVTNDLLNIAVIVSIAKNNLENITSWLGDNAPQLAFKLLIFIVIIALFRVLKNVTRKMVRKAVGAPNLRMSQLMQDFFISMSGKGVFCIGLLIALSQIGLDLTPILTGFGVAGVIIGFALQDTLSNFASGMMLLIYRPFDVGDFVEAGGVSGKVSHMSLVSTTIKTFDNQILIVPNSKIWGDTIKNVTHERVRRVDMVFGIGYSDDLDLAEKVFNDIIDEHPMVLRQPEKTIKLHTLNTSSVDYIVRPWVKTEDYWDVYWDVTREVKRRFDEVGLSIPFPQQDVHLHMAQEQAIALNQSKKK